MPNKNNAVLNLTSSRSCGRRNMQDIKTLLTAPISRICGGPQGRDDEGRMAQGNVGQFLPDNQIKRHSRMSLSGIPTAFNNTQGGDPRTLRAAASGMTTLLNSINPSPALRAPSPARGEGNDIRPSSPRSVGMRGIGAPRGFTLIELLVVVLIIAILAAIALPQYQKAVTASHAAKAVLYFHALNNQEQLYYQLNGAYLRDIRTLDINFGVTGWTGQYEGWRFEIPKGIGGGNLEIDTTSMTWMHNQWLAIVTFNLQSIRQGNRGVTCSSSSQKGKYFCDAFLARW